MRRVVAWLISIYIHTNNDTKQKGKEQDERTEVEAGVEFLKRQVGVGVVAQGIGRRRRVAVPPVVVRVDVVVVVCAYGGWVGMA